MYASQTWKWSISLFIFCLFIYFFISFKPFLEAHRDQSFLLLFHKIHCGTVSIEKDKYLTHALSWKVTRSSHCTQYCRYQTYSDVLKNSFFPRTIPHWNSLSPSAVAAQTTEEFIGLSSQDFICYTCRAETRPHSQWKIATFFFPIACLFFPIRKVFLDPYQIVTLINWFLG